MAEPKGRDPLASKGLSAFDISNTANPDNILFEHPCHDSCEQAELLDVTAASSVVSSPAAAGKGKGRSDSLITDTHSAPKASEFTMAKLKILPPPADLYAQQTPGPSAYFRCTFFNFDPDIVDLNKIGITYEYGDHYFIVVQLPHPQTSEPVFQCGFLNRACVGSYLVYEWDSLVKEKVGEWGVAVCDDDGRWAMHSGMLHFMRYLCGRVAKALRYQIMLHVQKRGVKLGAEKVKAQLLERFMTVFGRVEWDMKISEKQAAEEADKFMEEFMVFEA
ncbi:hypothetical protein G6011_10936 [Alternaria panax]|uniref:Uncharacterized protein n=1 Tax=Alternaria panax TaxID=48097 RepID=A0AAD4NQY7_9PLEO|nr:hypothetical protein G6011_10936 [Alternaria panax]